jgi:methionyl-tRNA formyltransferase
MRIVFFGTPVFAVASLQALLHERITVVGVVTQPDKPQGRSRSELIPPPVKVAARDAGIPVLQPVRPVGDVFTASLRRLEPDLGIVVAYGHILRPEVLSVPPRGMINVHASLLPRHRGAAPIQHAILAGDRATGISIMQMEEGLDSGPVLHHVVTPIGADETAGALAGRLADLGAAALVEAISLCSSGLTRPQLQDNSKATSSPSLDRELAHLDWQH